MAEGEHAFEHLGWFCDADRGPEELPHPAGLCVEPALRFVPAAALLRQPAAHLLFRPLGGVHGV